MNYALKPAHQVRKEIYILGFTVIDAIIQILRTDQTQNMFLIIYFQLFAKLKTVMGHVFSPSITRTNSITDAQEQMKMADILSTHPGVPSK